MKIKYSLRKIQRKRFYEANYGRKTKRLFSKLIYTKATAQGHASLRIKGEIIDILATDKSSLNCVKNTLGFPGIVMVVVCSKKRNPYSHQTNERRIHKRGLATF